MASKAVPQSRIVLKDDFMSRLPPLLGAALFRLARSKKKLPQKSLREYRNIHQLVNYVRDVTFKTMARLKSSSLEREGNK
jgi:hypothetical protein